jgi:hypothetical protein
LALDASQEVFDRDRFERYLALPRQRPHYSERFLAAEQRTPLVELRCLRRELSPGVRLYGKLYVYAATPLTKGNTVRLHLQPEIEGKGTLRHRLSLHGKIVA